jgi:hypothetical protein
MTRKIVLAVIMAIMCATLTLHAGDENGGTSAKPSPEQALQQRIAKLIEQLGSDKYEERASAEAELKKIGWEAREALQAATKNADPEVADAARSLLQAIGTVCIDLLCVDEGGNPIKNKKAAMSTAYDVTLSHFSITPEWGNRTERETNDKGVLRVGPFSGRKVAFKMEIDGYGQGWTEPATYADGLHKIRMTFFPPGTIKGKLVQYDAGDQPLSQASVSLGGTSTETDTNGCFELKDLPAGMQLPLIVNHCGRTTIISRPLAVFVKPNAVVEKTFRIAKRVTDVDPEDPQACVLECTIRNADGKPLANGQGIVSAKPVPLPRTRAFRWRQDATFFSADGNGTAKIYVPKPGKYSVSLFVPGFAPLDLGEHEFKSGEPCKIADPVKLSPGAIVDAVVKDDAGRPVQNAMVVAQTVKRGNRLPDDEALQRDSNDAPRLLPWGIAATDANGTAKLTGMEEDETAFRAYCPGYVPSQIRKVTLKRDGENKVEFKLVRLAKAEVTIVDEETKSPIPNTEPKEWKDDPNEQWYELITFPERDDIADGVAPGKRIITAEAEGYCPGFCVETFKPGETKKLTLSLRKPGKGALKGKIEATKDAPLSSVNYITIANTAPPPDDREDIVVRLAADGSFSMPELDQGTWNAVAVDLNESVIGSGSFRIEKGKATELSIPLIRQGTLEINCPDANRDDAENMIVWLRNSEPRPAYSPGLMGTTFPRAVQLGKGSKCKFGPVPAGEYVAVAGPDIFEINEASVARVLVTVKPGETTTADLLLHDKAAIKGKVISAPELPCEVYMLPASCSVDEMLQVTTDRAYEFCFDGTFEVPQASAGKYNLLAISPGRPSFFTPVEIGKKREGNEVKIRFPDKTQKFSGRVSNYIYAEHANGDPIVALIGDAACVARVRPDGTFEGEATPGKYKACFADYRGAGLRKDNSNAGVTVIIEEEKDTAGIEIP